MSGFFNEQNSDLSNASVWDMQREIRSREDVVAVQVWFRQDLKDALEGEGYVSDDNAVDTILADAGEALEDCADGWDRLTAVIADYEDELIAISNN